MSKIILSQKHETWIVYLLALVQFIHIIDFVILMPLGPLLFKSLNINSTEFAALVSAYNFSAMIASLMFGVVADRFERKRAFILTFLGFTISTALCGMMDTYAQFMLVRVMAGACGGILNVLVYSMIGDLIPFRRRGKATSVILSAFSVASVIGLPIGLSIADSYGYKASFLALGLASFVVMLPLFSIIPNMEHLIVKKDLKNTLKNYFNVIKSFEYAKYYFSIFSVNFSGFILIPFFSPYVVLNLGFPQTFLKWMYLVGGLGTVMSARVIGILTDIKGARNIFLITAIISIIPAILFTHTTTSNHYTIICISALFMMFTSGRFIPLTTMMTEVPKDAERGSFMSLYNATRSFSSALATFVGGLLISETAEGNIIGFDFLGKISVVLITCAILYTLGITRNSRFANA